MYSKLKDAVYEQLMDVLRPIQQRRAALAASGEALEMLRSGRDRAQAIARETMAQVRRVVGLGTLSA